MAIKDIANLATTGMGLSLVSHNIQVSKKKDVSTKDILGLGVTNILGTSLIRTQAGIVGSL